LLYDFDLLDVRDAIELYLANGNLSQSSFNKVLAAVESGSPVNGADLTRALLNMPLEKDLNALFKLAQEVRKLANENPALFDFGTTGVNSMIDDGYRRAIELGLGTFESIRKLDSQALGDVETSIRLQNKVMFEALLGNLMRKEGIEKAALQCDQLAQAANINAPTNSTAEQKKRYEAKRQINCAQVKVLAGQMSGEQVKALVSGISAAAQEQWMIDLTRLFSVTGSTFEEAISWGEKVQKKYLKDYATNPTLVARIQKATDERLEALKNKKSHPEKE
jgi:hypothetical protein